MTLLISSLAHDPARAVPASSLGWTAGFEHGELSASESAILSRQSEQLIDFYRRS